MYDEKEIIELKTRLVQWLQTKMPQAENISISDFDKPGMGLANVTYLFNLNWEESGQKKSKGVVFRSVPQDIKVHPESDSMEQYRIMDALKDTGVPVPVMLWMEDDPDVLGYDFFLMERLDGAFITDFPPYHSAGIYYDATPEQRAKMWWGGLENMAGVHMVDWKNMDLSFLDMPKTPIDSIDLQLAHWNRFYRWVKDDPDESHPILEAGLTWLEENKYEPEHITLCWGDSRLGNLLYDKDTFDVKAVLDWEMVFIGDPEADLAWFLLLDWQHSEGTGLPKCEGTPSAEETIARYEEITGWKPKNLFYNEVFGCVRFGIVLVSVLKNMKGQGISIADDMIHNNICTRRISELLGLPSPGKKKDVIRNLDEITASVQIHFTGPGGCDWYIMSEKGKGTRYEGTIENPDCSITVSKEVWDAIQKGRMNQLDAWSEGKLSTEGDLNLMSLLGDMISELSK